MFSVMILVLNFLYYMCLFKYLYSTFKRKTIALDSHKKSASFDVFEVYFRPNNKKCYFYNYFRNFLF